MQQLAAPNQPSNPAFSYFKNIGTIYYVKNLALSAEILKPFSYPQRFTNMINNKLLLICFRKIT